MPSRECTPLVSVVVPHLNQPEYLEQCLRSLEAQTLERSAFEIIVVDNGSVQMPEAITATHFGTRLLQESNPGPGLARNRGAAAAVGDILCFIDADCRARHGRPIPSEVTVGTAVRAFRNVAAPIILSAMAP